jgi:hypothetical protein
MRRTQIRERQLEAAQRVLSEASKEFDDKKPRVRKHKSAVPLMPKQPTSVTLTAHRNCAAALSSTNVRILPPLSARFVRSRSSRPHSAKTYENPARGTACRITDEFTWPATTAFIGGLMAFPQNA